MIRDPERFVAGLWDWTCLQGCFGDTKIEPTDLEGFVERKGQFLILETKAPGATVPKGQEIMFKNFAASGIGTVMILWGHRNAPEKIRVMRGNYDRIFENADMGMLCRYVSRWFDHVNQNGGR